MLTQEDLQAIGNVIDQKLNVRFAEQNKILFGRFDQIDKRFKQLDQRMTTVEQQLKPIKRQLRKIQHDLTATINFFDREHLSVEKRVTRIENHLHLS